MFFCLSLLPLCQFLLLPSSSQLQTRLSSAAHPRSSSFSPLQSAALGSSSVVPQRLHWSRWEEEQQQRDWRSGFSQEKEDPQEVVERRLGDDGEGPQTRNGCSEEPTTQSFHLPPCSGRVWRERLLAKKKEPLPRCFTREPVWFSSCRRRGGEFTSRLMRPQRPAVMFWPARLG